VIAWLLKLSMPKLLLGGIALAIMTMIGGYVWGRWDGRAVWKGKLDVQVAIWKGKYDAQVAETARMDRQWKAKAEETERELQGKLDSATAAADDLVVSLRHYRARRCPVPAVASGTAVTDDASGITADSDPVEAALDDHLRACARDAERLTLWQTFYDGLLDAQGASHSTDAGGS